MAAEQQHVSGRFAYRNGVFDRLFDVELTWWVWGSAWHQEIQVIHLSGFVDTEAAPVYYRCRQ